jgi:II/X family phage/plasmid replication protein
MLDTIRLQIPINDEYVLPVFDSSGLLVGGELIPFGKDSGFLKNLYHLEGIRVASGEIEFNDDGTITAHKLSVPYQSIPSSNSTLAFCLYKGGSNYWPFIEINASAAKLIQGHNAYGSDNLDLCAMSMLSIFFGHFGHDFFDTSKIEVAQIDITYSAHVSSEFIARQVIDCLKHVKNGQVRATGSYDTSAMFNAGSKHCVRLIYLKQAETLNQINEITKKIKNGNGAHYQKQLDALQSDTVQGFIKNSVRFEAKIKKKWMHKRGIPTNLLDLIEYLKNTDKVNQMWLEAFKPILDSLKGESMNIYDDTEVLEKLKLTFTTYKKDKPNFSKALRLFRFFRSLKNEGFHNVKETTPERTFYRLLSDLTKVVSKAALQNLVSGMENNIIPLFKVVNIDFNKQVPTGYVEPEFNKLRLVV